MNRSAVVEGNTAAGVELKDLMALPTAQRRGITYRGECCRALGAILGIWEAQCAEGISPQVSATDRQSIVYPCSHPRTAPGQRQDSPPICNNLSLIALTQKLSSTVGAFRSPSRVPCSRGRGCQHGEY